MKVTDYAPRAAPFDELLRHRENLVGVEVGVDAGAHAEALLKYCPIKFITLIDPWPNAFPRGFCEGRLSALGFRPRYILLQATSLKAAAEFRAQSLDFIYLDQIQDGLSVLNDLQAWWPKLKAGGVLGHRNYAPSNVGLVKSVDEFARTYAAAVQVDSYAGEAHLFKTA